MATVCCNNDNNLQYLSYRMKKAFSEIWKNGTLSIQLLKFFLLFFFQPFLLILFTFLPFFLLFLFSQPQDHFSDLSFLIWTIFKFEDLTQFFIHSSLSEMLNDVKSFYPFLRCLQVNTRTKLKTLKLLVHLTYKGNLLNW